MNILKFKYFIDYIFNLLATLSPLCGNEWECLDSLEEDEASKGCRFILNMNCHVYLVSDLLQYDYVFKKLKRG